jgi:hypothetical protein
MGLPGLHPRHFAHYLQRLPAPPLPPITAPSSHNIRGQQQNGVFSHTLSINSIDNPLLPLAVRERQSKRRFELEDGAYPLMLVRALDKISGQLPIVCKGKPVFGVIHVNNPRHYNLVVELVGTYTTVQAANDRVLDFWHRHYGTGMFTEACTDVGSRIENNMVLIQSENTEEEEYHRDGSLPQVKPKNLTTGGIAADHGSWKIDNQCLCLRHKDEKADTKVYTVISYVEDYGFQV